jgi:hypothetical protein
MIEKCVYPKNSVIDKGEELRAFEGPNSKSAKGALAEIEVASDLMRKGFSVFRNLSPVGPVDMVAISNSGNGEVLKIQATVGSVGTRGSKIFARHKAQKNWNILTVRFSDTVRYYDRSGNSRTTIAITMTVAERRRVKSPKTRNGRVPRWVRHPTEKGTWVHPWDPVFDTFIQVSTVEVETLPTPTSAPETPPTP